MPLYAMLFPIMINGSTVPMGRAFVRDVTVDGVVLRTGDRLEPCVAVRDTGVFDAVVNFPLVGVVFWRRSRESLARRRNPNFDHGIGLDAEDCLAMDVLHAINLRIMLALVKSCVSCLIVNGIYGKRGT